MKEFKNIYKLFFQFRFNKMLFKLQLRRQIIRQIEIKNYMALLAEGGGTLIWNARYCPSNNTTQANPYKSRGSGYPVDPSE